LLRVVELLGMLGVTVVVHASGLFLLVLFDALDSDLLVLDEQVCVNLKANFQREIVEIAGVCHGVVESKSFLALDSADGRSGPTMALSGSLDDSRLSFANVRRSKPGTAGRSSAM
jgi:hypothetical protein